MALAVVVTVDDFKQFGGGSCRQDLIPKVSGLGFDDTADTPVKDEISLAAEQVRCVLAPPSRCVRIADLQHSDGGSHFDHEA